MSLIESEKLPEVPKPPRKRKPKPATQKRLDTLQEQLTEALNTQTPSVAPVEKKEPSSVAEWELDDLRLFRKTMEKRLDEGVLVPCEMYARTQEELSALRKLCGKAALIVEEGSNAKSLESSSAAFHNLQRLFRKHLQP